MTRKRPFATPQELAEYLSVPEGTLRQWRYRGAGPAYSKVGELVRYDWSDVEAWVAANRQRAGSAA